MFIVVRSVQPVVSIVMLIVVNMVRSVMLMVMNIVVRVGMRCNSS